MKRLRTMRRNRDKERWWWCWVVVVVGGWEGEGGGLVTKRDCSSRERTKFVHEREREEREDVTTRMQVCKYKKYIYHSEAL